MKVLNEHNVKEFVAFCLKYKKTHGLYQVLPKNYPLKMDHIHTGFITEEGSHLVLC